MAAAIFFDGRVFDDLSRERLRKSYSVPVLTYYDSPHFSDTVSESEIEENQYSNTVRRRDSLNRYDRNQRTGIEKLPKLNRRGYTVIGPDHSRPTLRSDGRTVTAPDHSRPTLRSDGRTVTAPARNRKHVKSALPRPVMSKTYRPGTFVETYRRSHSNNQYRQRPENLPRQQTRQPMPNEYPVTGSVAGSSGTSSLPLINGNQRTINQIAEIPSPEQFSTFGEDVTARLVQREREELGRLEMAEIFDRAEAISRIPLSRMAKLKQLLNLKAISENTLQRYGVCALPSLDGLMFPRYSQSQIMQGDNVRPTGVKIFRLIDNNDGMTTASEEVLPNANTFNGIFGYHLVKPTDEEVIVVDSELDAMAINQATGQVVLALPDGTGPLSIDMLPYLEEFLKLTLWVPDEKYNRAKQYARRLVTKRCYLVSPRRGRPLDLLSRRGGAEEVRKVLRQASEALTKDVDTFMTLRDTVRDEIFGTGASVGIAQWKRFTVLNQFFRGFRLGELTLLTGPAGCGKTTFLSEYSLDLCDQNVNTLWCSFEIPNSRLVAMMVQQYGKKDVTKDQNSSSFDFWYEKLMQLPMYFAKFRGNTKMKTVSDAINYHVAAQNIQHVIIDNLQFMLGNGAYDEKQSQEQVYSEFRRLATTKNIHITIVVHPRKDEDERDLTPNSMYGGTKGSQEADNMMIIQTRFHRLPEPYQEKYLQIWKNRFFGDLHLGNRLSMIFDPQTKCHMLTWRKKK